MEYLSIRVFMALFVFVIIINAFIMLMEYFGLRFIDKRMLGRDFLYYNKKDFFKIYGLSVLSLVLAILCDNILLVFKKFNFLSAEGLILIAFTLLATLAFSIFFIYSFGLKKLLPEKGKRMKASVILTLFTSSYVLLLPLVIPFALVFFLGA